MSDMKIELEHILLLVIGAFILYHFMSRCVCSSNCSNRLNYQINGFRVGAPTKKKSYSSILLIPYIKIIQEDMSKLASTQDREGGKVTDNVELLKKAIIYEIELLDAEHPDKKMLDTHIIRNQAVIAALNSMNKSGELGGDLQDILAAAKPRAEDATRGKKRAIDAAEVMAGLDPGNAGGNAGGGASGGASGGGASGGPAVGS